LERWAFLLEEAEGAASSRCEILPRGGRMTPRSVEETLHRDLPGAFGRDWRTVPLSRQREIETAEGSSAGVGVFAG